MVRHPTNVVDPDYVVFKTDGTNMLTGKDFKIKINTELDEGFYLLLKRRGLFIKRLFGPSDVDNLEDRDKRFALEDYMEKAYFMNSDPFTPHEPKEIDVLKIMPVDESFKAEKALYLAQPELLLNRHGFLELEPVFDWDKELFDKKQEGYKYCEMSLLNDEKLDLFGWIEDIDEGIEALVKDFNKLDSFYVNYLCCSGLCEDHNNAPSKEYGYIRFKVDEDSDMYDSFSFILFQVSDKINVEIEVRDFFDGKEVKMYPKEGQDNEILKQAWAELHNEIKYYLERQ